MDYNVHSMNSSHEMLKVISENGKSDLLSNDNFRLVYQWVMFAVLCQTIDIFGVAANTINIICFIKQGFKDPVNVSLLGVVSNSCVMCQCQCFEYGFV